MKFETLVETLEYSKLNGAYGVEFSYFDLRGADLIDADLSYANLRGANLRGANLNNIFIWRTSGNSKEIFSLQTAFYLVNFIKSTDYLQIGCKNYTVQEWVDFSDSEIDNMASDALEFWSIWKPTIMSWISAIKSK